MDLVIGEEDPRTPDVRALLERHLGFTHRVTPEGHVHALDVERLADPAVALVAARSDGVVLGVGALRAVDATLGEIKSMHTAAEARRSGVGRAVLDHLIATARARGYERVSLETGTSDAFAPARDLYAASGFVVCPAFGEHTDNPHSVCMTLALW